VTNSSTRNSSSNRLGIQNLLVDVTSERLVEYELLARNIMSPRKQSARLDIGSGSFTVEEAIREFEIEEGLRGCLSNDI
jgi:hypothetical protein